MNVTERNFYIYLDLVGVLDFHEKGIFVFFFVVDASRLIFMRQQMCFPPPRPRSHLRSTHRIWRMFEMMSEMRMMMKMTLKMRMVITFCATFPPKVGKFKSNVGWKAETRNIGNICIFSEWTLNFYEILPPPNLYFLGKWPFLSSSEGGELAVTLNDLWIWILVEFWKGICIWDSVLCIWVEFWRGEDVWRK